MSSSDEKLAALKAAHALNPHPETVLDPTFGGSEPFFDPRDLVQVKYEMLRRVHLEKQPVTTTTAAFGFSRPSFYTAQAAWQAGGLPGLLPARSGPRAGHKLTDEIVAFLKEYRLQHPQVSTQQLVELLQERYSLRVHPRSVERALVRLGKKL
jgi:transposase